MRFTLPTLTGGADDDAARWIALGREPLERMLDLGAQKVSDRLFEDFATAVAGQGAPQIVGDWRWTRHALPHEIGYESEFVLNAENLASLSAAPAAPAALAAPATLAPMAPPTQDPAVPAAPAPAEDTAAPEAPATQAENAVSAGA